MQKEYFVVKTKDSMYHMISMDTHMMNEEFSTVFLIKDFNRAVEIVRRTGGNIYELTIIEEKVL